MKSYAKKHSEPVRAVQWLGGAEQAATLIDQFGGRLCCIDGRLSLRWENDARVLIPGDWLVQVPGDPLTSFSSSDFYNLFEERAPTPTEIISSGLEHVRKAQEPGEHDEYLCTGCRRWRQVSNGDGEHVFCDDCWAFWQQVGARLALSTARSS